MKSKLPLFVLVGNSFLCEEKRKEILSGLAKQFGASLAVTLHRAEEVDLGSVFAEARTLPFLSPAQVICLQSVDRFSKGDIALWQSYFESPAPHTTFIFEAESLEKGHPFLEWGGQAGQLFFLQTQKERMVASFIRRKLQQAGKTITSGALEVLESRLGDSLAFLDSMLEQLILYVGDKSEIDSQALEALEEQLAQFEGRDFVQALLIRDLPKALAILNRLLEVSDRDLPSLIGLLHWQLRRFWEAKKALTQGVSEQEMASRLGLWSSRAQSFFSEVRRFSLEELERVLEGLFELDWRIKSGRGVGLYEMENWLISGVRP